MTTHESKTAQSAKPEQVSLRLSELNTIDKTEYKTDEYGAYIDRPNLNVCVTLSYATEDYIRVLKTLTGVRPIILRVLQDTYGTTKGVLRYYDEITPLLDSLIEELSKDMGYMVTDCLCNWDDNYL